MPRAIIAILTSLLLGGCQSLTEFEESEAGRPQAAVVGGREATAREALAAQRQSARRAREAGEQVRAGEGRSEPAVPAMTPPPATMPAVTEPAVSLSAQALQAEADGRWEDARRLHASEAVVSPGAPAPLLGQARALMAQGRHADAATMLESWARSGLATPELHKATGDAIMASGSATLALTYYERAWRARPDDEVHRIDYAAALNQAGRHADAVTVLDRLHPDQMSATELLLRGRAALLAYQPDAAAEALARYLRVEPADVQAWLDLSRAHLMRGDAAASLEALRPVVKADPHSPQAAVLLGHIHVVTAKPAQALHYYELAQRLGADVAGLGPVVDRLRDSLPEVADR